MKVSGLLFLIFACVGLSHSAQYLAWKPGKNYVYEIKAKLKGPQCETENGGLVVDYKIILTPVGPNSIHLNPHDFRVVGVDEEQQSKYPIIAEIKSYVESSMQLNYHNGKVDQITVNKDLPDWAMDIKKEQAGYFSADSNGFYGPQQPPSLAYSNGGGYKYKTEEDTVHGQCETKYKFYRVNDYSKISDSSDEDNTENAAKLSQLQGLCDPRDKFYEIVKSVKLDSCSGQQEWNSSLISKPIAISRILACGRRSRNQFKVLKIQQEIKTSGQNSEPEKVSALKLIGINQASQVKQVNQPMILTSICKSSDSDSQAFHPMARKNLGAVNHPSSNAKKVVVGHMANTPGSVRWALQNGANAVEVDLRFSGNQPSVFQHSVGLQPCDCTCACAIGSACPNDSICKALWTETGSHCKAGSSADTLTKTFGDEDVRSKLALIQIDNKLTNSMVDFFGSGYNLVKLLDKNTFDRGYQGQVLISGLSVEYTDFLKGALKAAKESKYTDKYFYTFDGEGKKYEKVWDELLQLRTNKIAYATGITICVPTTYYDAITQSLNKEAYSAVGIWTLDKPLSIDSYARLGVDMIVTNKPNTAAALMGRDSLASPGEALVPKHVPEPPPVFWQCDCNYHKGGCTISKIAPHNRACKCIYRTLLWTCRGETVTCKDDNAEICKNPDASYEACKFGGGDCGGY